MARPVLKRPRDMFTFRRVLAFWAAVLAFTVAAGAQAQTVTPTVSVTKTGVTHSAKRSANRPVTYINHADCLSDDVMTFPITATGFTGYSFQAWVGTNCTDVGTRTLAGQRTCWQVLNSTFQQLSSGSNTSGSTTVQLHVRSLVDGYTHLFDGTTPVDSSAGTGGTSNTAGTGGADSTATAGAGGTTTTAVTATTVNAGIEACDQPSPENVQAATAITVFFMLVDTSSAAAVASTTWAGTFKLVGPQPPDQITAGVGGNLLVVGFKYSAVSGDTTRNGFNIYCDPAPGSDAAVDAGLVGDGGVGTALVCATPLTSSVLVTGNDPPIDSQYKCGSGQATSQTANATNLVDGVAYNVAVAAIDSYENTGPLSALACEVPQPVTGFYKAYRDAGGQAGGGFCSISNRREPILVLAVLGIASCLVLRRRRAA